MIRAALTLSITMAVGIGCGDDDPAAPVDAGLSCLEACSSRATSCAIPAVLSTPGCRDLCRRNPSDEQIGCIADARCPELEGAFSDGTVCGVEGAADAGPEPDSGPVACAAVGETCSSTDGPTCCADETIPLCDPVERRCCLPEGSGCSDDSECCGRLSCELVPGNTVARCASDRN